MKKFALTTLASAALLLCLAPNSQAGPGFHVSVVIGRPVYPAYYPPPYRYYGPYYGRYHPRVIWHRGYYYRGYRHWH